MSTMMERDFRAWVVTTLTITTLYALVFAGLCVFSATARIALLLGAFLSPFALPIIYPLFYNRMSLRGDLYLVGTVLLFLGLVFVVSRLLCPALAARGGVVCFKPTGSCLIMAMPSLVIIFGMWLGKRFSQARGKL